MGSIFKRFVISAVIIAAFVFPSPIRVSSSASDMRSLVVLSRVPLDISGARVSGERAPYFIDLTSLENDWVSDVIAQREIIGGGSPVIERVSFFVRSYTRPNRDFVQLMFAIYIIDRWAVNESDIPYEIVNRSKDYVFAVRYGTGAFESADDRFYHAIKMHPMDTPLKMRRFIVFPPEQQPDYRNTVFVEGIPLNAPGRNIGGLHFVQIREACEIMGYTVRWDANTMTVTVSKGLFTDSFRIHGDMTHDHRGIPMRLINDRTYVSTHYFGDVLHKSISFVPRTGNILIS